MRRFVILAFCICWRYPVVLDQIFRMVLFRLFKCCCWKLNLSHLFSFHFVLSIRQFNGWSLKTNFCQIEIEIEIFTGPINNNFVTNNYGECPESQLKKKDSKIEKCLAFMWPDSFKTDSKTLYYSILKLKYSPSMLKHNKG